MTVLAKTSLIGGLLFILAAPLSCDSTESATTRPADAGTDRDIIRDPDTVAPEIRFLVPADGQENVSARTPIRAVFSEPVKLGSALPVLSANGAPFPNTASLSSDGKVLTITPTADIPLPATMSVDFAGITDIRGNALIRPPWHWTVPLWLRVGSPLNAPDSKYVTIAAGPDERVNALEMLNSDRPGTLDLVLHRIGSPTDTWSTRGTVDQAASNQLAALVDKDGVLVTAFLTINNEVAVRRDGHEYPLGSSFPSVSDTGVALAMDAAGMLFVAYDAPREDGGTSITILTLPRGGDRWTLMGVVKTADEKGVHVRSLALDKKGTPYVAYVDSSGIARVRGWTKESWPLVGTSLNGEGEQALRSVLAIDDSSNIFVLVDLAERVLPRSHVQILRLDGTGWNPCGPEIAQESLDGPTFFAPARNNRIFSYLGLSDRLEVLEVTRNGWTRIPPPAITPQGERLSGGMGAIDPQGVPIIAWMDFETRGLQFGRLNQ